MNKVQKVTAIVSLVIIVILGILLGIFLWKEQSAQQTQAEQEPQNSQVSEQAESQSEDSQELEQAEQEQEQELQNSQMPEKENTEEVTMIFTGDVLLGSNVRNEYDNNGINGILSEYLQQEMIQADITMVNEEFPFSTRGTPMPDKQYTFRVDPRYMTAFHEMGIDVVSLANNHALDYGTEALMDTFAALDEAGIPYVGAGDSKERAAQPAFLECGNKTVGILSASRVIPVVEWNVENQQPGLFCTYDSTALVEAIEETRTQCDYLVVYVHWGVEHQAYPEEYQRQLAQAYIDAGADLVVGAHPHVPQGIEYYRGKPIIYSLGNFIFNPDMSGTYMIKVAWNGEDESRLQIIPIAASDARTSELDGQEAVELIRYIEEISYDVIVDESGVVTSVN